MKETSIRISLASGALIFAQLASGQSLQQPLPTQVRDAITYWATANPDTQTLERLSQASSQIERAAEQSLNMPLDFNFDPNAFTGADNARVKARAADALREFDLSEWEGTQAELDYLKLRTSAQSYPALANLDDTEFLKLAVGTVLSSNSNREYAFMCLYLISCRPNPAPRPSTPVSPPTSPAPAEQPPVIFPPQAPNNPTAPNPRAR